MTKRKAEVQEELATPIEKEEDEFYPLAVESEESELSFADIVDEVAAGKWGNGQQRRLRLSRAGHDHVAVQKELVRRANTR